MQALKIRNQNIAENRVACTDAKLRGETAGVEHLLLAAQNQMHRGFDVLKQHLAFLRERNALGLADKERLPEAPLQSADRLADRRLRDEELAPCLGKTARSGDIVKYLVQFVTDIHNAAPLITGNQNQRQNNDTGLHDGEPEHRLRVCPVKIFAGVVVKRCANVF